MIHEKGNQNFNFYYLSDHDFPSCYAKWGVY